MNLSLDQVCYLTFKSNKTTAHTLTELAHIQGITQEELLQKICEEYIDNKMIEMMAKIPPEMLSNILKGEVNK